MDTSNISPLLEYTLIGLASEIKENFKVPTVKVVTEEGARDLVRNHNLEYPICFLNIESVATQQEGIRTQSAVNGILVQDRTDTSEHTGLLLSCIPAVLSLKLSYLTNDYREGLDFMCRWMHAAHKFRLNFMLEYAGINFSIVSRLTDSLAVPEEKSKLSEAPNMYEYTGEIATDSYLTNDDARDIQEVPIIHSVNATATVT
jgi:hypothetical protein